MRSAEERWRGEGGVTLESRGKRMDWNICSLEGRGGRGGGWLKCDVAREKKLSEKKEKKTAQAGLRVTNFERLHLSLIHI